MVHVPRLVAKPFCCRHRRRTVFWFAISILFYNSIEIYLMYNFEHISIPVFCSCLYDYYYPIILSNKNVMVCNSDVNGKLPVYTLYI